VLGYTTWCYFLPVLKLIQGRLKERPILCSINLGCVIGVFKGSEFWLKNGHSKVQRQNCSPDIKVFSLSSFHAAIFCTFACHNAPTDVYVSKNFQGITGWYPKPHARGYNPPPPLKPSQIFGLLLVTPSPFTNRLPTGWLDRVSIKSTPYDFCW